MNPVIHQILLLKNTRHSKWWYLLKVILHVRTQNCCNCLLILYMFINEIVIPSTLDETTLDKLLTFFHSSLTPDQGGLGSSLFLLWHRALRVRGSTMTLSWMTLSWMTLSWWVPAGTCLLRGLRPTSWLSQCVTLACFLKYKTHTGIAYTCTTYYLWLYLTILYLSNVKWLIFKLECTFFKVGWGVYIHVISWPQSENDIKLISICDKVGKTW